MALPDFNLILNLFTLALLLVAAVPVLRSKRKDAVIAEQLQVIDSHERRIKALEQDLIGAQERANQLSLDAAEQEKMAVEWRAKYAEQTKYTAAAAVEHFESLLVAHQEKVAERHQLMIGSLETVSATLDSLARRLDTA